MPLKDLTGKQFGRWTVICRDGKEYKNGSKWICRCSCGTVKSVFSQHLTRGVSQSCGCLAAEKNSETLKTHGMTNTRLFHIWQLMRERCYNSSHPAYNRYGGRGICVCKEWENFQPFYNWAMINGYAEDLTIDRIDNNGNYEPDNCRWVNLFVQANNKCNNRYFPYNGELHTLPEWSRLYGISFPALRSRVIYHGWTMERALTEPIRRHYRRK